VLLTGGNVDVHRDSHERAVNPIDCVVRNVRVLLPSYSQFPVLQFLEGLGGRYDRRFLVAQSKLPVLGEGLGTRGAGSLLQAGIRDHRGHLGNVLLFVERGAVRVPDPDVLSLIVQAVLHSISPVVLLLVLGGLGAGWIVPVAEMFVTLATVVRPRLSGAFGAGGLVQGSTHLLIAERG
jgi:hypothetical protein